MSQDYAFDVCMEPIFWIVDNFVHLLGPVSVSQAQKPGAFQMKPLEYVLFNLFFFLVFCYCGRCFDGDCGVHGPLDRVAMVVGTKPNDNHSISFVWLLAID